jgi:hypothetical protein
MMSYDRTEYETMKFRTKEGPEQIAAANAFFQKDWQPFTYYGPEFVETLKDKPTRYYEHPAEYKSDGSLWSPAWQSIQVCHDGRWYHVCRTDLTDNVTTWGAIPFGGDGKCQIRYERSYGARVTDDTIYVIDSWSDG